MSEPWKPSRNKLDTTIETYRPKRACGVRINTPSVAAAAEFKGEDSFGAVGGGGGVP